MKEIEIKILNVNRKILEKKLISLGAKKIFEGDLFSIIFDNEQNYLKNNNLVLRLRKEGDKNFLTFKKKISKKNVKFADELETQIKDFKIMKKILLNLGFKEKFILKKSRVSYKLNDLKFEFDNFKGKYKHIPEFLEIEGTSKKKVIGAAKKLGFSNKDIKAWSTKEVINYYFK